MENGNRVRSFLLSVLGEKRGQQCFHREGDIWAGS